MKIFKSVIPLVQSKSKFYGFAARITTKQELDAALEMISREKVFKKAHHNPYAFRYSNFKGQNCDGETGASFRLSELLSKTKVDNVVVLVSRQYGGKPLGPQRFRLICNCALDLLQKHFMQN